MIVIDKYKKIISYLEPFKYFNFYLLNFIIFSFQDKKTRKEYITLQGLGVVQASATERWP